MAHKKYIKRGNYIYGPYLYENYRENGVIKTRYLGKTHETKKKTTKIKPIFNKNLLIILGITTLIILLFFSYSFFFRGLTGRATLEVVPSYSIGEQIQGELKLLLKYGELIPSDTKIIINNAGEEQEHLLSELISEQIQTSEGNFYVENIDISGQGSGYGTQGSKKLYPTVYFTLNIFNIEEAEPEKVEEEVPIEEAEGISEEVPEPEIEKETVSDKTEPEITDEIEEKVTEEQPTGEPVENEPESPPEPASITGESVTELENEIFGQVSKENLFTYPLEQGKTAKIKSGSVKTDEKTLPDDTIKLKIKINEISITTDYSDEEKGFGEKYLTDDITKLKINLQNLNLIAKQGDLIIKLMYNEKEIVSVSEKISVVQPKLTNKTLEPVINETILEKNITISNETLIPEQNITISNETIGNLTIETTQYSAVINKPVKWKKTIKLEKPEKITVELPKQAENITVIKLITQEIERIEEAPEEVEEIEEEASQPPPEETINETIQSEEPVAEEPGLTTESTTEPNEASDETISEANALNETKSQTTRQEISDENIEINVVDKLTGEITASINLEGGELKSEKSIIIDFFKNLFSRLTSGITGKTIEEIEKQEVKEIIIDEENITEFEIEYETPAPTATETNFTDNKKQITIIGPETLHYKNVLAYIEIPESEKIPVSEAHKIKLYWVTEEIIGETSQEVVNEIVQEEVINSQSQPPQLDNSINANNTNEPSATQGQESYESESNESIQLTGFGIIGNNKLENKEKKVLLNWSKYLSLNTDNYNVNNYINVLVHIVDNQNVDQDGESALVAKLVKAPAYQAGVLRDFRVRNFVLSESLGQGSSKSFLPLVSAQEVQEINITSNETNPNANNTNEPSATQGQESEASVPTEPNNILIYKHSVNFTPIDTDEDGYIDYIEWIVPSLSNQTYELIIEISKAEHLDENRSFISDIYEDVKALDGNWSEEIPNQHYVRVTFEQNLTSENDITVYARGRCNGTILINNVEVPCEIYEKKKRIDELKREVGEGR